MASSAAACAPGAATIRACRVSVKWPLPIFADTGLGTMPGVGAAVAAGRAGAALAVTANRVAGTPITRAARAADQRARTAGRRSLWFMLAASMFVGVSVQKVMGV